MSVTHAHLKSSVIMYLYLTPSVLEGLCILYKSWVAMTVTYSLYSVNVLQVM